MLINRVGDVITQKFLKINTIIYEIIRLKNYIVGNNILE